MVIGAVGDLHGDFDALYRAMRSHRDVPCWLCVGDVADDQAQYPSPPALLYWIKGNNEDFDFIARQLEGEPSVSNLHYLPNSIPVTISGLRVVGLGGTFAPTWYDTPAAQLPRSRRPATPDDKRRHFVREEVEACLRLRDIDILLSHEAARPFIVDQPRSSGKGRPIDAGKTPINELLGAMRPRLHLFGHHHRFSEALRQEVPSVGLDLVGRSYLLIDAGTLRYQKLETPRGA